MLAVWVVLGAAALVAGEDAWKSAQADEGHGNPGSAEAVEAVEVIEEVAEAKDPKVPMCTYNMSAWNTKTKTTTEKTRIEKPYAEITGDEISPENPKCTLCEQDQVSVSPSKLGIKGVDGFKVCREYAPQIEEALKEIAASPAFKFVEITGYRPGRTRGKVVDGLRTELSNHSYGTAIDINADYNGLYNKCDIPEVTLEAIAGCTLGVGGEWNPKTHPKQSVVKGGPVYDAFTKTVGWKWGGEISGGTRDLMHFSITGY